MKTAKFQLKNGLQVILAEAHKSPVASIQMWVRTGSADEKKKEEGISHFIEHLVFKGTRQFRKGEIASIIEGSGGALNAYTSFDQTVFYVTISKQFINIGLEALSEMMGFPLFEPEAINSEREVVIEEIKMGQDSLGRRGIQLLFKANYKKHSYRVPVIGYEKNIKKLSPTKISEFYKSRYTPRNMFLVLSGDFNTKTMKSLIQKFFGHLVDHKTKKILRAKEPVQTKPRILVEHGSFEQSIIHLAWKIPSAKHKDIPALDVLGFILGQGESSRLVQKLRVQSALVNSVYAMSYSIKDSGLFTISMNYNKEKLQASLDEVLVILSEILSKPIETFEIVKAVLNVESGEFFHLETVEGLSRQLGSLEFYFNDLKAQEKYMKALRRLTPADILKVARKYLNGKTLSISVLTNDNVNKVNNIASLWVKAFLKQAKQLKPLLLKNNQVSHHKMISSKKLAGEENKTEKINLPNGVTILMRPCYETEVISVKAALRGGLRAEPPEASGLCELLSRTWTSGTRTRSEKEIALETESIASSLTPLCGRNSIGLGLAILAGFQKQGAPLFTDVLLNSTFPQESFQRERIIQLEEIKTRFDNPGRCCGLLFMKSIFAGHPYSRDLLGSEESLKQLTPILLNDFLTKSLRGPNLTICLCGNFDKALWLEEITSATQGLPSTKVETNHIKLSGLENSINAYQHAKKEQSHIIYGYRGITLTDPRRYALHIMQSVLAGQGGRLFMELRDKHSLAYSVSPMKLEGVDAGYFGAHISCSPDKAEKAISMMEEQFQFLVKEEISPAELLRAQQYLIGHHDIDLQTTNSICSSILYNDIYGIDYNEAFTCAEKYRAVTTKDIHALAKDLFSKKAVVATVGPQDPFLSN